MKQIRAIRGVSAIAGLVVAASFIAVLFVEPALHNSEDPVSWAGFFFFIALAYLLVLLRPLPIFVLFSGLLLGGHVANIFYRKIIGPVPDYILVPGSRDWYCNLADIAILFSIVLLLLAGIVALIKSQQNKSIVDAVK